MLQKTLTFCVSAIWKSDKARSSDNKFILTYEWRFSTLISTSSNCLKENKIMQY